VAKHAHRERRDDDTQVVAKPGTCQRGRARPRLDPSVRLRQCAHPLANVAQSYGTELFGGGAMSFHNVTLPSAPNLYSSVFGPPGPGLLPWSHAAFRKMDEGVESGSCCKPPGGTVFNLLTPALTSIGSKPPGVAVHCVTLPSFPNLNSCRVPSAALPLNHTASLNAKGTRGSKPSARPVLRAVHFVTLPSFPSLYS